LLGEMGIKRKERRNHWGLKKTGPAKGRNRQSLSGENHNHEHKKKPIPKNGASLGKKDSIAGIKEKSSNLIRRPLSSPKRGFTFHRRLTSRRCLNPRKD